MKHTFLLAIVFCLFFSLGTIHSVEGQDLGSFFPKSDKRTSPTIYLGFGPTFITSNVEEAGVDYPEFAPFKSWSTDLGIMLHTRLGGTESKFKVAYGLLWRYLNLETNEWPLGLLLDGEPNYFQLENIDYKNTELNIHTLSIPLLFEYDSKFSFALGGFVAYRLGSSSESDDENEGVLVKKTTVADFGLNDLLYGATVQVGGKHARLYANYYLNNIFKNDKPYDFTVLNIGVAFF